MTYDLLREGAWVRDRLGKDPQLVARARAIASASILGRVLLALSDCGFYEYLVDHPEFTEPHVASTLNVEPRVLAGLLEYLIGCGYLARSGSSMSLTEAGTDVFNAYARGVINMYVGAYAAIFDQLSDVLAGRIALGDPALQRSPVHTASGTSYLTCGFTLPEVFRILRARQCRTILDLGCGSGDFLVQWTRSTPDTSGVGIDVAAEALDVARANAAAFGVSDRLRFSCGRVGATPLDLAPADAASIEAVTAMYMLHEFGRDGRDGIIGVIRALRASLPGRLLVALEVEGLESEQFAKSTDAHRGRLDYWLIHVLSQQGLPRSPMDWHRLFEEAGCTIESDAVKTGGSYIYQVRL